jgi:hypothetical protein
MGGGIVSSIIASLIVMGGGVLFAYLRSKHSDKAPIVLYGFAGAACIAVLCYTIMGRDVFSFRQPTATSIDNVEENIKKWTYDLGFAISPAPSSADYYFAETVTLKNGLIIAVGRMKERPGFLQLDSVLSVAPEHQTALTKLTVAEANIVSQEVLLELARSRVEYAMTLTPGSQQQGVQPILALQNITIIKPLPVNNLTEGAYLDALSEVEADITMARAALVLSLARHAHT